jgi:hypothetical protein
LRNGIAAIRLLDVAPADDEPAPAGGGGPDPTAEADRRSYERFVTVFRLAKLIGAREEFCLIRNVSAGGLKAEAFSPKTVGDRLAVDFGDEQPRPARVAWVANDNIGISFDQQIDVARALSKAPPPGRSRARPIRLLVELDAVVATPASREDCQLIDISQGGAKVRMELAPKPGDKITLAVRGLGKISGVVRWAKKGKVGIVFPVQLPYRQLAAWVASLTGTHD